MIHKRPFIDDDSYEVACKHPRHLEYVDQLASVVPLDDTYLKPMISGNEFLTFLFYKLMNKLEKWDIFALSCKLNYNA